MAGPMPICTVGNSLFTAFARQCAELEAAPARVPHQLLGPLSAALWVRFAATHTRHHVAIAREILTAAGAQVGGNGS